jgi:ClpP class serine protease
MHEQPVPIFQQLARGHPSGRDDVRQDDDVPLDMVLHTPGGLVLAALQIAQAVRDHKSKVTVFVPHYAMSGGTLIALSADEIVMCKHSILGPIGDTAATPSRIGLRSIES